MNARPSGDALIGREFERAELDAGYQRAAAGRAQLFLIAGESGIGKTRLAQDIAGTASRRGALVAWGRCWPGGGAPPFWPWTQALKRLGIGEFELRQDPSDPGAGVDPEAARFAVFDAAASRLEVASRLTPIVLLLDDLHAADEASLLLLRFVVRQMRSARLLVVGMYRDMEARRAGGAYDLLAEIARDGRALRLRGLPVHDVRRMADSLGLATTDVGADALYRATGGNPFFLRELLRGPVGDVTERVVPETVRQAIGQRLVDLQAEDRQLLALAAVIGRDFDIALLATAAGSDAALVAEAVGRGVIAGLLVGAGPAADEYRFAHDLARETVYDDLGSAVRAQLHHQVALAIETAPDREAPSRLAQLAHHFFEALPVAGAAEAIAFGMKAAQAALSQHAYEDAVAHLERALRAVEVGRDDSRRGEVLLGLGRAVRLASGTRTARPIFLDAAALARRAGRADHLAEAALGIVDPVTTGRMVVDVELVTLLREAMAEIGEADSGLRAQLLAALAVEIISRSPDRSRRLAEEAVTTADRIGDPRSLEMALAAQHTTLLGQQQTAARLAVADRLVQLADAEQPLAALTYRRCRVPDLAEMGRFSAVDDEVAAFATLAERAHLVGWQADVARWRAMRVLVTGPLDRADALVAESVAHQTLDQAVPQLVFLRWQQGRLAEIAPVGQALMDAYPGSTVVRSAYAFVLAALGHSEEARSVVDTLAHERFAAVPTNDDWPGTMALLTWVCSRTSHAAPAAALYELLLPHDGRWVVTGAGSLCLGPVSYSLGLLAATAGRANEASRHYDAALTAERNAGAGIWLAHTLRDYGRSITIGQGSGALAMLEESRRVADELGLTALAADLAATPAPSQAGWVMRRDGDSWVIECEGEVARFRDTKGLQRLGRLLAFPGVDVPALELLRQPLADADSVSTEQARQAVTKSLRTTVARIATQCPGFAEHLTRSVRTGVTCSYRPPSRGE